MNASANLASVHARTVGALERYAGPVFDLVVRLWMANVFFKSGRTKIADWSVTVALFEDEYQVPVLPAEAAALLGTARDAFTQAFVMTAVVNALLMLVTAVAAALMLRRAPRLARAEILPSQSGGK